ncbi:uncharacterized protein LOC123539582 isoform X3 [Mercenaria mercenaria]|uniref:uncharacterized protein LOC123539582 isoform X3 n=1 Tax=Mercenaria mercenaria TaxID=6596 RepID=UPI00234F66AA|nr:uncharacterized protein LOC123539582 isoform X3 [Mercenaria mercenaria]
MASTTIKKHLMSEENIQIPTYKKLPPIQNTQKMPGRKVISPASVSVDFNPPDTVQSKQLLGGKAPVRKASADSIKYETLKSAANQNSVNKRTSPIGSGVKSSARSSGDVALDQPNKGIELIGYRMTNDQSASSSAKLPVPQQASDWTPLSSELPPCRICGDKASGLHYGVNTCEACKAFFRRTLKKSTVKFQCTCTPEEKALGTDEPRKTTCPKCRYERCIKTGMSKDAIKIGRYTISRKRQNDQEVKTMKKGERTVGVRRVSESSKSTSSSSPYSTSQSVSSPEELSSDITSLSLQETRNTHSAKKRRHDDEDGLLYQSLTNSIFQSLMENQFSTPVTAVEKDLSPVEQLLTSGTKVNSDVTPMEQLLISNPETNSDITTNSIPDTDLSAVDSMMFNGQEEEAFSPLAHILSTLEEASPIENLLTQPVIANSYSEGTGVNSKTEVQLSPSQIQNGNSGPFVEVSNNSVDELVLTTSLFGIYDGTQINSKAGDAEQLHDSETSEESPIENLLKAPLQSMPYSPAVSNDNGLSSVTYDSDMTHFNNGRSPDEPVVNDGIPQELSFQDAGFPTSDVNTNLLNGEINETNIVGELEGNVFVASKLSENEESHCGDSERGIFTGKVLNQEDYTLSPEDIEIQEQQLSRFENPAIRVGEGLSVKEATDIILTLGQAAGVLFESSKKMSCEEIKKRHADYLEQYVTKMQVFGNMSNISKEEYLDFYNQTGIDIDNRQQILIEALKYMEESIGKLVKFAKAIPGFSDLDIDDQVNLVKVSRFEQGMIQFGKVGKCVKSSLKVATLPWNKEYHFDEISKIFPRNYCTAQIQNLQQVLQLGLSFEETVVLKALIITFPDRCELKEPEKVEYLHNKLIACFLLMLAHRPPDKLVTVQAVMGTLFRIRHLAAWDTQIIQEMFEVWPVTSNHQLVKEFVS